MLVEVRHHHLLVGVALERQRDADIVGGDVLDVHDLRQLPREDDLADPLDELRLVDGVGDALDVDGLRRARVGADVPGAPKADRSGAGLVNLAQLLLVVQDLAAGREVRSFDVAAELGVADLFVFEQLQERGADLAEVVRRDARRHADGDAGRAVHQQARDARGQDDRLGLRPVVVRPEVDGVLVDLHEQLVAQPREPAFGVAHRRGVVAVERSEVTRPVNQRVAHGEGLRDAHEGVVDRRVAVRMVAAHHVADDLRALPVLGVGRQVLLPHRVEDAALHRLEAVADVRQRARRDDRQRVVEVPGLRRLVERNDVMATPTAAWPIDDAGATAAAVHLIEE